MTALARRYARALFEAVPPAGRDSVAADLAAMTDALAAPGTREALADPRLSAAARRQAYERLGQHAHATVRNFLRVLLARRREAILPDIAPAFRELLLASRGEIDGVLETAKPLDQAAVESLAAMASRLTKKRVVLRVEHEPALIGGVRLRVGNTLFDSSVASAIEDLERRLMAAPL